jgi:CNT family concentrative nucleoside transporter
MLQVQSAFGLLALVFLAWLCSENRKAVSLPPILVGIGLQLCIALAFFHIPMFKSFFLGLNTAMEILDRAVTAGTSFVFGYLGGGPLPFAEQTPGRSFILTFKALPIIIVISALSAVLYHLKIIPILVRGISLFLQRTMRIGGALAIGVGANIFAGMVEAPLFVRPYLRDMTRSELFALMTSGMATIAGTVLVLYASFLQQAVPGALGHILTASVISVPAALVIAGVMVPESESPTAGSMLPPRECSGVMDAVHKGTSDGLGIFLNVVAMLLVLVALVALVNQGLGLLPDMGGSPLSLERVTGYLLAPVAWLLGIPWDEAVTAGSLLGTKTVLNELLAYLQLAGLPDETLGPRSRLILTYALCGFANLGSLGIMIGGLGGMVPERKKEIVEMGMRSIWAGLLATCMTGAIVGILTAG